MKYSFLPVVGILSLALILAVIAAPQVAIADVEKQDSQQGGLVVAAEPGGPAQPPPSSGDVQERGLPPRVGPGIGGGATLVPMTFKCSAETYQCKCFGTADCDWFKQVMGKYCQVPLGCTQNCECRISK
jgi:hypothetical protein